MWYVIQVAPNREHEVIIMCNRRIRKPGEEFFVMKGIRYLREKDGSWRENEVIAFPRYVFADTDDIENLRERLMMIPDLTKVVHSGDDFYPIYPDEEALLKVIGGSEHLITASVAIKTENGLEVIEGGLMGHEDMIKWVNTHKRLACLELELSGHKSTVKVGLEIKKETDLSL